jgi:hypothetical protein
MFAYITNITYITNYVTNTINTYEGAGHLWHVSIAEQPSVTPTTAYDRPMVASFAVLPTTLGLGSNDTMQLTSDGGQEITIKGTKFGPMLPSGQVPYLNPNTGVTYGPTGVEYLAKNCRVTTNSTEIKCTTVAGMGGPHRWLVTIMEQTSVLSAPITSYARPIIESITPLSQTSDGKILGLRIVGVNFGLRNTDPKSIVFDQQELNENNGGFSTRQLNGGRDQIDVDLPACGGVQSCGVDKVVHFRARSMGVIVDSENTKTFSYTDPYIDELSVYPPANAGESGREVEARGWSFCESTACASLLFSRTNGTTWTQISHEHAAVNPHGILSFHVSGYNGYVKVRVNGKCGAPPNTVDCQRDSNEVYFRTLSPVVDSATVNMLKCRRFNTNGGETVDVVGTNFGDGSALAVFVGGLPATIVTGPTPTGAVEDTLIVSTMTVEIPPNVGAAHYLVVKLDSVASSVLGDAPIVRYRTPYITKVEVSSTNAYLAHLNPFVLSNDPGIENPTARQRLTDAKVGRSGVSWPGGRGQADTMGSTVTITGRNFGAASMGGWVDYEYAG